MREDTPHTDVGQRPADPGARPAPAHDHETARPATNVHVDTAAGTWPGNGRFDRVRWGPIWAGLVTAIATFLLLTTAAIAIGAQVLDTGVEGQDAGMAGGIVSAVIALVAFFAGGYIAAHTAGVIGRGYGALNGFLVWALGVVLILALAAFGLGSLFGASGDLFAQYRQMGQPQIEGVDPQQVVEGIRTSSIGAFIGMLLPALAAAGGGLLGGREDVVVDR